MSLPRADRSQRTRRAAQALVLWQSLVLAGIVLVTLFAIWHLRRRSRVIRAKFKPQYHPEETLDHFQNDPAGTSVISLDDNRS